MTPLYTPKQDKTITLGDGRQIQVAVKDVPMALSDAVRYGLVKPDEARSIGGEGFNPSEIKTFDPSDPNSEGASTESVEPKASTKGARKRTAKK